MLSKLNVKKDEKGFTLIELMIVIAIIGILAAIAIPQFSAYKDRAYNTSANSDVKNAYTAAIAYFGDQDNTADVTLALLKTYGYKQNSKVDLTVTTGTETGISFTAKHDDGPLTYTINANGDISHD
jgi:type IV pilus assembly protein PilA